MVDRQLTLIPTDIDPKGPAAPLGSKNVHSKCGSATKSILLENNMQTEKFSHKNGGIDENHRQVSQCNHIHEAMEPKNVVVGKVSRNIHVRKADKSASKAKKAKVVMIKKFVTRIGDQKKPSNMDEKKKEFI